MSQQKDNSNVPRREIVRYENATNMALAEALQNQQNNNRRKRKRTPKTKKNRQQPAQKRIRTMLTPPRLSACAAKYASALLDPQHTPTGACVPFGFPQPSQKAKGYCSTRMVCGTQGVGFVLCRGPTSSDTIALTCTSAASTGGLGSLMNLFGGLIDSSASNLPYTNASLGANPGVSGRLISQIVKVRFAGKEVDRNGTVYCYEQPEHMALAAWTPNQVMAAPQRTSERPRMDGGWHTLLYSGPIQPSEVDYGVNSPNFFGSTNQPLVVVVNGLPGDIYDVELYNQVEYIGSVSQTGPAESDVVGYSDVISTVKNSLQGSSLTQTLAPAIFKKVAGALSGYAKDFVRDSISMYLSGRANPNRLTQL
jgi:hypothetical protein